MHNWRMAQLSMSDLPLAMRASMPVAPVAMELAFGRPRAHLRNPRRMGEVCPQLSAAADVQGGRIAGFGAYDVTNTKFSIRLGPPSCSPPV
jgi:hypothetical protein